MDQIFKAKSIVISRKPGKDKDGLKTAFIGLFEDNNPHLKAAAPIEVVELEEVEKVRIKELRNISYYLMGNDIVINDLVEVHISLKGHIAQITGKQNFPDED